LKIRFQTDADIDPDIRSIDSQPAAGIIPEGTLDPEVLAIAADDERVIVSGDLRTMSVHFQNFIAARGITGSFADSVFSLHRGSD
jgi:hypothetical protein